MTKPLSNEELTQEQNDATVDALHAVVEVHDILPQLLQIGAVGGAPGRTGDAPGGHPHFPQTAVEVRHSLLQLLLLVHIGCGAVAA